MVIEKIDKEKFFKPVPHPRTIKNTFLDIYAKLELLDKMKKDKEK